MSAWASSTLRGVNASAVSPTVPAFRDEEVSDAP
jgi:hypothetical protein